MTAREIVAMAVSFVGQTVEESGDLVQLSVGWLNVALQEVLPTENGIRRNKRREELAAAPLVTDMDTVIDYDDVLCRQALPYYLACCYLQDDDQDARAVTYYNRYVDALSLGRRMTSESVVDFYAETDY